MALGPSTEYFGCEVKIYMILSQKELTNDLITNELPIITVKMTQIWQVKVTFKLNCGQMTKEHT